MLSRYLDVNPDVIALDRSATGKPFLNKERRDRSSVTFNLSHAHDRALIAVSKGQEVGIDLEFVRADVEVANLSKRFFSPSEHAAIMQATEERRAMRFFRYWVAKEALLKAQGIGLEGLPNCEIVFEADGIDTNVQARLGAQFPNTLRVRLLPCEKGWEAAVAASEAGRVRNSADSNSAALSVEIKFFTESHRLHQRLHSGECRTHCRSQEPT